MKTSKHEIVIPVLLLAVGVGWLLSNLGLFDGIDFAWPLGLAAAGVLALIIPGITKRSIVVGPFLIVAGGLSLARQLKKINWDIELPCLVITLGALLVISHLANVPSGYDHKQSKDD